MSQGGILDPVLSGLLGGAETAVSQIGDGVTSAIGGVTSVVGGVLTPIIPPSSSSSSRSSTSATPTPSKSSATPLSTSSLSTSGRSTTSQSSSRSSSSSSSSSSPSTTPTPASQTLVETTSDGIPQTITSFVTAPAVTSPSATPPPPKSFLQNKPLSGFVFALAGIVGLVLVILVATFAMRRSKRKKLENEAADISYDPGRVSYRDNANLVEKGSVDGYSSNGHSGYQGAGYGPTQRVPAYGQYPNYAPRSPNPYEQHFAGVPAPNQVYVPGRGSPELYRSASRSSDSSAFGAQGATATAPPVPPLLLNGGTTRSPPPVASAPPPVTALPATFGDQGSLDERQGVFAKDLKVANQ